jgi:hypothetical protein
VVWCKDGDSCRLMSPCAVDNDPMNRIMIFSVSRWQYSQPSSIHHNHTPIQIRSRLTRHIQYHTSYILLIPDPARRNHVLINLPSFSFIQITNHARSQLGLKCRRRRREALDVRLWSGLNKGEVLIRQLRQAVAGVAASMYLRCTGLLKGW